jgi:hypothetical protein
MRTVFGALDRCGLAWFLTGSEALAVYGTPRQTLDTDLVIDTDERGLEDLIAALGPGYAVAEPIHVGGRWMASVIETASVTKVDLIVRDPDPWGVEAMARRRDWAHPTWGRVWVSSLEDLVLAKREWSEGISELQLRDCAAIIRLNRTRIDDAYLDRWAAILGLRPLLEAVRHAA